MYLNTIKSENVDKKRALTEKCLCQTKFRLLSSMKKVLFDPKSRVYTHCIVSIFCGKNSTKKNDDDFLWHRKYISSCSSIYFIYVILEFFFNSREKNHFMSRSMWPTYTFFSCSIFIRIPPARFWLLFRFFVRSTVHLTHIPSRDKRHRRQFTE